jgi:hypothetical protein
MSQVIFTWSVPIELLRKRNDDTVMLLRLNAGLNAMDLSIRLLFIVDQQSKQSQSTEMIDLPTRRLFAHTLLASVAYHGEIVKMLDKEKYLDRLCALAQTAIDHGFDLGRKLDEVKPLLTASDKASQAEDVLLRVRNKVTFHWDPEPFQAYIDKPTYDPVELLAFSGPQG